MPPRSSSHTYATSQKPSPISTTTSAPPKPRQYVAPEERISRYPKFPEPEPPSPPKRSLFSFIWPFGGAKAQEKVETIDFGKQNLTRGVQASQDVVKTGALNPRYKFVATRLTLAIAFTPVAIYLSYELYERRFNGKEQKPFPMHKVKAPEQDTITTTNG
ncbi:hypothetical protein M409DRAFT_30260 [Zasmidium cellare ATCC 36951]|uniref:Uncharacterized protein n=1 Tax=Zasmidium cellare ATCC 36951 TaxID=1080233 RepID=A0A6A6BWP5_ZASCE|nr:uncharacterized protein M409DRAFT_30260 [Zasmidium cellare ATCC 36951]KAF2159254.1 hypothetical protein M409DRAFT_30260 [Zasmidium cellare ATCC 36951]